MMKFLIKVRVFTIFIEVYMRTLYGFVIIYILYTYI